MKGNQEGSEGSEGSFQSYESHSGYASQHKKHQHVVRTRKVASDTLPLKAMHGKASESDSEEMKEAARSLLHLVGIRSCLNNIASRTPKGQQEQKETSKN